MAGLWRELTERSDRQTLILIGLFVHTIGIYLGIAFSVAAIIQAWRDADDMQQVLLATMLLLICYFLGQLVFWEGSVRFRFPITPYLVVLSGYGYAWFWVRHGRAGATPLRGGQPKNF